MTVKMSSSKENDSQVTDPKTSNSDEHDSVHVTSCSYCGRKFSRYKALYVHMRKFHKDKPIEYRQKSRVICSLCNEVQKKMRTYWDHIQTKHPEVQLSFEKKCFYSEEDFDAWKKEIEASTCTHFASARSQHVLSDGRITQNFLCDRSGYYQTSACVRKSAGTKKIGTFCPVYISRTKTVVGDLMEIEVEFQSTHMGHKFDVPGIRMRSEQRERRLRSMGKGRWPKKTDKRPSKAITENAKHEVPLDEKAKSYLVELSEMLQNDPNLEIQHITCNCKEYTALGVCEHIQEIVNCLNEMRSTSEENSSVDENATSVDSSSTDASMTPIIMNVASVNPHPKNHEKKKSLVLSEFQELVNMCQTQKHFDILKEVIAEGRKRLSSTLNINEKMGKCK